MKQQLLISLLFLLTNCSQKKAFEVKPKDKTMETKNVALWTSIDIKSWDKTPAINDRIATEDDVKKGFAVFFSNETGDEHVPYKIQLPKLAYLTETEMKKEELVVVIQIEITSKYTLVGYRNFDGGNGICLLNEVNFLKPDSVATLTKK